MSRRDEKRQAYASQLVPQKQNLDADKKGAAHLVCGLCKHYLETSWSADGRGSCSILKFGSNISANPPVYVLEGKEGFLTKTLSDASACKQFEKMQLIDKDGYECSDPVYRRTLRQLQEKE
ncbi:MAG: hypothetical protein MUE70_12355 [Desulfobacterales bacterium]|nr:hypothetical protein [Desulfobacterales bacterium]